VLAALLGTSVFAFPAPASGIDHHLCISPDSSPLATGCGLPCENDSLGLSTDGAVVETAVPMLPDLPDGSRPWVSLCIQGPGTMNQTIEVHNENGQGGSPLFVTVEDVTLCPMPMAALPEQTPPVFRWIGASPPTEGLPLDRLSIHADLGPNGDCAFRSSGILVYGGGALEITDTLIRGARSLGIGGLENEVPTELLVTDTHLLDTEGPAIQNWASVTVRRSEITGTYLADDALGPAVLGVYGDGSELNLATSVLFGNVVEPREPDEEPSSPGLPIRPALVYGNLTGVDRSIVVANVLASGAALFRVALPNEPRALEDDNSVSLVNGPWMSNSVLARNVHLETDSEPWPLSAEVLETWPAAAWPEAGSVGCANLDPAHPYFHRTVLADPLVTGVGSLLEFESGLGVPDQPGITLQRNFFVGNKLGVGPLVRVDGAVAELRIQLLHNTIADNGPATFLELANARSDTRIVALKNLFAASETEPAPEALVGADAPIRALISSMNAGPTASLWSVDPSEAESVLDGPHPTFTHADFQPACDLQELADCERYQQTCPSVETTDCADQPWPELPCALDEAAGWVPTAELLAQLGGPWPWETDFYPDPRAAAAAPGATGGVCAPTRATFDELDLEGSPWGDGDGYPDAVDCDNTDPELGPIPPTQDGYASWFCTGIDGQCYACPEGSEPPPTTDVQPTIDKAETGEEALPEPEPELNPSYYLVDSGCSSGGCGISYGCSDTGASAALLLFAFPLGWRRRQQP